MSYHVHFSMSVGLSGPLHVPAGTKAAILAHVREVEKALGLKATQYRDNPPHWERNDFADVDDKRLCEVVSEHNDWVRWLYRRLAGWSKSPVKDGETLTPADARKFWHGLETLTVPPERWSADYYRERMERLYEVMRGRETDGISFDAKPLTEKQAEAVIVLFSEFLDTHDIRLAIPEGYDSLRASDDGGYSWCDKCGAIAEEEVEYKVRTCRKRGGCPLREEYGE